MGRDGGPRTAELVHGWTVGHARGCCQEGFQGWWRPGAASQAWSYLQVAPSPPGVWFRGRHAACSVGEQVLVELHSLVADRYVVSEARGPQAFPAPHPDPPHLAGHVEADGHDGCVSQLKDSEYLTAHDSQRPPRHKGSAPKHILQEALGHYWGNDRKRIRVVRRGERGRREKGRERGQGKKEKERRKHTPRKQKNREGREGEGQCLPGLSAGCWGATS